MLCAIVQNNVVIAVQDISQDQIPTLGNIFQSVIDITTMSPQPIPGWICSDGQNITPPSMRITKLAFESRLSISEEGGIAAFVIINLLTYYSTPTNPLFVAACQVFSLMRRQQSAAYVDLLRADTIAGVGAFVTLGLLTSDRAHTILTTPPAAQEIYNG